MIPDIHKTMIVTGASQGIGAGLVKASSIAVAMWWRLRGALQRIGFKASDKLELVDGSIADPSTATRIAERN